MARKSETPTRFVVVGRGRFPVDMLRYDSCWPASSEDARKIEVQLTRRENVPNGEAPVSIALTIAPGYSEPTVDRWVSFGWLVKS